MQRRPLLPRPSYLTRRQHTTLRDPRMTHMGHTTTLQRHQHGASERAAINSMVAQQPPINTTDLPGPLGRPLGTGERLPNIRRLRRKKRALRLVPKLSKTRRIRHLQAGEKKSQNKTKETSLPQLACTANKTTKAPVPGWPARPWQPTMHRGCDGRRSAP